MRDVIAETDVQENESTSCVPISQILDSRTSFPSQQLSFEILLETTEAWQGLELCARIALRGLPVTSVIYRKPGRIFLLFQDVRAIDPREIAALFASASQVFVSRWTTVLGGITNPSGGSDSGAEL